MKLTANTDRAMVMTNARDGRTIALGKPTGTRDQKLTDTVTEALAALNTYDETVAHLQKDKELDPADVQSWKWMQQSPLRDKLRGVLSAVDERKQKSANVKHRLTSPPPIPDSRLALDIETRARFEKLPDAQRSRQMAEMGQGKHRPLLEALARSPVGDPLAEGARGVYSAIATRENAAALAAQDDEDEHTLWLETSAAALMRELAK